MALVPIVAAAGARLRPARLAPIVVALLALGQVAAALRVPPARSPLGVAPSPAERRTVVLITADTLRRDHVSAYPDAVLPALTPAIDALAAEGALFLDAATTAPLTLPSHATLLTGLHPLQHGVVRNGRALPPDLDGAPAELARAGFRAGAFTSSLVLHGSHGMRRWFHVYRDDLGPLPGSRHLLLLGAVRGLADRLRDPDPDRLGKERGDRTVARALAWLDRQPADASVFLWVHLYDAHTPHTDHPGIEAAAADLGHPCDWSAHPAALRRSAPSPLKPGRPPLPAEAACRARSWAHLDDRVAAYAEEVRFLDAQVGALLDGLRARGRYDDAGIVLVADHGESLVEHQHHVTHQYSLYDPVVRVPLVVRAPGCAGCPAAVEGPVSTLRVASTLRWLAGLPARGAHLLERADDLPIAVGPAPVPRDRGPAPVQVMARRDGRKVLRDATGHVERYDLAADPAERRPLVTADERARIRRAIDVALAPRSLGALPALVAPLGEEARAALSQPGVLGALADREVLDAFAPLDRAAGEAIGGWTGDRPDGAPSDEVRRALEALGYVE